MSAKDSGIAGWWAKGPLVQEGVNDTKEEGRHYTELNGHQLL